MTATIAQRKVLVLNKGWSPIGVMPLERAMGLIFGQYKDGTPKAKILESNDFSTYTWEDWSKLKAGDGEAVIKGVHQSFKVPEIILLTRYNKFPQQRVNFSRRTIYKRDENQCQYCGCKPGTAYLSIDHIVPKSKGGATSWTNVVLACTDCNRKKADKSLEECGFKLLHKPYRPKFSFFRGEFKCDSWQKLLDETYWSVDLQNDMPSAN